MQEGKNYLYLQLADELENTIQEGHLPAGEKLPSLRQLHHRSGKSITTVYQAYMELERRGLVTPHARSGFVVNPGHGGFHLPSMRKRSSPPVRVSRSAMLDRIVSSISDPSILHLGGAYTSMDLMPGKHLGRIVRKLISKELEGLVCYENTQGSPELRRNLAKWLLGRVGVISSEDLIITNGGTEGISICLRAMTSRGDAVLIESPVYPGVLQIMEEQGLYAVEVPTHPEKGIDLEKARRVMDRTDIKAAFLTPTVHNPMGYIMSEEAKKAFLGLLYQKNIPLIEDDTYGELAFGETRPRAVKYFDTLGRVLYLSSFSKTVGGGLRVGYVIPGIYMDQVMKAKLSSSLTSATITQRVMGEFLSRGALDRHLRDLRNACRRNLDMSLRAIRKYFPPQIRVSSPSGGFLLWIEMPEKADSMELFNKAWGQGISIFPGTAFSVTGLYRNCFRLNCGNTWSPGVEEGFQKLGKLVSEISG
ncbi:MAG: PLP-dependent aminotransferase family protein [Synergistales bacterium]|nr:PLP-dependent aminotransferase family protein [Synergistales bacterium]